MKQSLIFCVCIQTNAVILGPIAKAAGTGLLALFGGHGWNNQAYGGTSAALPASLNQQSGGSNQLFSPTTSSVTEANLLTTSDAQGNNAFEAILSPIPLPADPHSPVHLSPEPPVLYSHKNLVANAPDKSFSSPVVYYEDFEKRVNPQDRNTQARKYLTEMKGLGSAAAQLNYLEEQRNLLLQTGDFMALKVIGELIEAVNNKLRRDRRRDDELLEKKNLEMTLKTPRAEKNNPERRNKKAEQSNARWRAQEKRNLRNKKGKKGR
jgi:hypothetical protein